MSDENIIDENTQEFIENLNTARRQLYLLLAIAVNKFGSFEATVEEMDGIIQGQYYIDIKTSEDEKSAIVSLQKSE